MTEINNPFTEDEVVGVAPARTLADVTTALRSAGFELEVLEGPTDADEIDITGDNVASKIKRFFQQGEERDTLEHFHERLEMGDDIVRIVSVGDQAELAGSIFVDNGGETIWHYGKWTYRKLHG